MSLRISDRVDINEQRKHLNKLDQEIERAMQGTPIKTMLYFFRARKPQSTNKTAK